MTNFTEKYLNEKSDFDIKFDTFLKGCQKLCDDDQKRNKGHWAYGRTLTVKPGKKYIKLLVTSHDSNDKPNGQTSVFAFVNKENGDVLKPAGFKAPAKGARGNIFDDKNGLGRMSSYGPAYNKG